MPRALSGISEELVAVVGASLLPGSSGNRKGFVVPYRDFVVWSVNAYIDSPWKWPAEQLAPLSQAIRRKSIPAGGLTSSLPLATLRFDGTLERRSGGDSTSVSSRLFLAEPGDLVFSKIDVRNGATGMVPHQLGPVAVTAEYPVYEFEPNVIPEYVWLLFRSQAFRDILNSMISGHSGRKRVHPDTIESLKVPLPDQALQRQIVNLWRSTNTLVLQARSELQAVINDLDHILQASADFGPLRERSIRVRFADIERWDVKSSRASAFARSNTSFQPLGRFAEEVTELVRPMEEPEKLWPVYGVNNKEGVFFSHHQLGADFKTRYKKIRRGMFFHNPTRANVGSIGMVPSVPIDAITSPEYQVWRVKSELEVDYVAALVRTGFFLELIHFHRVGGVKERLYVENLLQIPIPVLDSSVRTDFARRHRDALEAVERAKADLVDTAAQVESLIVGDLDLLR